MNRETGYVPPEARELKNIAELDEDGGREIAGLESKTEHFSHLEENVDYHFTKVNDAVHSARSLQDFLIFINPSGGTEERIIHAPHWRSSTKDGVHSSLSVRTIENGKWTTHEEPFYCVNTKGVGYLKPTLKGENIENYDVWTKPDEPEHSFGYKMLGLSSKKEYETGDIMAKSRMLIEEGLRTETYWAIARLDGVYFKGDKVSVDELRQKEVIIKRKDYHPYMGVRLLKTNDRIEEARYAESRRQEIFEHAFEIYNQENHDTDQNARDLAIEKTDDQKEFFKRFFIRMGENIAVLLNTGYFHFRLHSSNITLAAEIVDIGTMSHWTEGRNDPAFSKEYNGVRRAHLKDMRDMIRGLKKLRAAAKAAGLKTGESEELQVALLNGFDRKLGTKKVSSVQETDPVNARKWLEGIFRAVIIEGKKLPALLNDDTEDYSKIEKTWDIKID